MNWKERFGTSIVISDTQEYSVLRIISSFFLTLLFLSIIGANPIIDRRIMGSMGIITLILSQKTKPNWRDYPALINEALVGFFLASLTQLMIMPLTTVREFDFAMIVIGGVSVVGMLCNRKSVFVGKMAKIAICCGMSVIILNLMGGLIVNSNYSTNSWIVGFCITISGFYGLRYTDNNRKFLDSYIPVASGFVIGIWQIIISTQQSDFGGLEGDFGYRYSIEWAGLHHLYAFLFATILFADIRRTNEVGGIGLVFDKIIDSKYSIPVISAITTAVIFIPGLDDSYEPVRHVDWHMGLYNILAQNLLDYGVFNRCGGTVLVEGDMSSYYSGCWVYPTYWFNPLIWPLAIVTKIGFNPIISSRIIVLICQFLILLLLGRNVEIWFGRGSGALAIVALVSSMQLNFYGEIYAPQLAIMIWCLALLYVWSTILKGNDWGPKMGLIWALTLFGPIAMGASTTIFGMSFFALSYLFFEEYRGKIAKGFVVVTSSGIASWFIWRYAIDYYWGEMGGSETNLIGKARYRSQSFDYLSSADYYITTLERAGWLLNVVVICGLFLLVMHICFSRDSDSESKDFAKKLIFFCSPFILMQIQVSLMFPQSINQHDYLNVYWLIIPGSVAFASLTRPKFSALTLCFLIVSSTIVASDLEKMDSRHEGSNNPHLHQIQDWMYHNLEGDETILLTDDLYRNSLIVALSSNNVLVRPINDSSDYPEEWLMDSLFDVVLVNSESAEHWHLFENEEFLSGWCLVESNNFEAIMPYHTSYSFHIYEEC